MAIAKMKLITISAEKEHLLDVLQKFIDLDYFHPEPASKFIDSVHGLSSMDEENPVAELSARFQEICSDMGLEALEAADVRRRDYDMQRIRDYIEKIDEAVALIFSISGQTNLLSLNASIEAARAGEAGRGFAVVAEEIRKLSEQSAAGAEQIKNLAQGIMEKSGETVEQADVVKDIIREEQDHIIATREQYQQLEQSIRHSAEEIRKIAGETGRLSQQKEDILGNIGSLSAISEENAANNQQVNANIEEILTQIQTVGANCDKMKQISGELESSVAYFHTEKEPAGK